MVILIDLMNDDDVLVMTLYVVKHVELVVICLSYLFHDTYHGYLTTTLVAANIDLVLMKDNLVDNHNVKQSLVVVHDNMVLVDHMPLVHVHMDHMALDCDDDDHDDVMVHDKKLHEMDNHVVVMVHHVDLDNHDDHNHLDMVDFLVVVHNVNHA